MPGTLCITSRIFPAVVASTFRSLPNSLTEFSPLTPEAASSTLSSMYCEKLKSTPGNLFASVAVSCWREFLLVDAGRPGTGGASTKEFCIEEARRIRTVVGPTHAAGDHGLDFREAADDRDASD